MILAQATQTSYWFNWDTKTVAAIVAAIIAYLAWHVNREKLRFDLSSRRYALYKELRNVSNKIIEVPDDVNAMSTLTGELESLRMESSFIFRSDVENRIESCIKVSHQLITHISRAGDMPRAVYANEKFRLQTAISFQILFLSKQLKRYVDFRSAAISIERPVLLRLWRRRISKLWIVIKNRVLMRNAIRTNNDSSSG